MVEMDDGEHDPNVGTGTRHPRGLGVFLFEPFIRSGRPDREELPTINVGEGSSTTLALVIHELATNSAKYGSLSVASGTLDVSCNGRDDQVVIMWTERGGPPISAPATLDGFGSKLIHRSMAAQLGGSIDFDWSADGVVAILRMSKDRLAK
jgi:two-component sensor histidine kinase